MSSPKKQVEIPKLNDCQEQLQRAVAIKLHVAPEVKVTDRRLLELAGFHSSIAGHSTMIMRFRRMHDAAKKKQEEAGGLLQDPMATMAASLLKRPPAQPSPAAARRKAPPALATQSPPPAHPTPPSTIYISCEDQSISSALTMPCFQVEKAKVPKTPNNRITKAATKKKNKQVADNGDNNDGNGILIEDEAMTLATRLFQNEMNKPMGEPRKTTQQIVDEINQKFGSNITASTLVALCS